MRCARGSDPFGRTCGELPPATGTQLHLYEDLVAINRPQRYRDAVLKRRDRVLNVQNRRRGVLARRGDATFGEIIPGETPAIEPGYVVARGPIARLKSALK